MNGNTERFQTVSYAAEGPVRLSFRLPEDWKADLSLPNVGLFYPESELGGPGPAGGMLAVNVETKKFDWPLTPESADAQVRAGTKDPTQVMRLGPERWVIRAKSYKQELAYRGVVHVWVLVRLVTPNLLARVGFVFNGVDTFHDSPGDPGYATIDLLEREIEAARVTEA